MTKRQTFKVQGKTPDGEFISMRGLCKSTAIVRASVLANRFECEMRVIPQGRGSTLIYRPSAPSPSLAQRWESV